MTAKQRSKAMYMTPEDARSALVQVSDAARKAQEDLAQRQGKFAALEEEAGARLFDARLNSDTSKEAKIEQDLDKVRRGVETAQRMPPKCGPKWKLVLMQRQSYSMSYERLREHSSSLRYGPVRKERWLLVAGNVQKPVKF